MSIRGDGERDVGAELGSVHSCLAVIHVFKNRSLLAIPKTLYLVILLMYQRPVAWNTSQFDIPRSIPPLVCLLRPISLTMTVSNSVQ